MVVGLVILLFIAGFELLVIISLYADRVILMSREGDIFMNIFKMDDKVFDILKWVAIVCLPALSTFVVVISKIWGWGDLGSMIAQTITAVAVLLGTLLGISTIQYNKRVSE